MFMHSIVLRNDPTTLQLRKYQLLPCDDINSHFSMLHELIICGISDGLSTLKFDGQSQYLRVSDSPAFDFGEDATIFIVAKGDTLADWRPILSKRNKLFKWRDCNLRIRSKYPAWSIFCNMEGSNNQVGVSKALSCNHCIDCRCSSSPKWV